MRIVIAFTLLAIASAPAHAEDFELVDDNGEMVRRPLVPGVDVLSEHVSKILFLNRCADGCVLTPGNNDARYNTSRIVAGTSQVSAWRHGDSSWQELMSCVKELYAPYDVNVTDVDPGDNVFHHEAIVAGSYEEIGYPNPVGGVAPSQCRPANNVISFTFANTYGDNPIAICHTVGQETAHSYGLEHARDCSDPMTYMQTCTRQFFRDATTKCGEYEDLDQCLCGGSAQNSHRWLQSVLGESAMAIAGPVVDISTPTEAASVSNGFRVATTATHVRGIGQIELFLNGTSYGLQDSHGYDNASSPYWFDTPATLADGIIDVEIHATNDIGSETIAVVTVQKGEPCTSEAACLDGQSCEDGRCRFPPADGILGESCASGAECLSGLCPTAEGRGVCSETCFYTTTEETCPDGFACTELSPGSAVCWPKESNTGGCGCQSTGSGGTAGALLLLFMLWGCGRSKLLRRKNPCGSQAFSS